MIDLMYILIAIITSILSPVYGYSSGTIGGYFINGETGPTNPAELQKYYLTAGPGALYKGVGGANHSMWGALLWQLPNNILSLIPTLGVLVKIVGGLAISYFLAPLIKAIALALSSEGATFGRFLQAIQIYGAPGGAGITGDVEKILFGITGPLMWIIIIMIILLIMNGLVPIVLGLIIWLTLVFIFFRIFFMLISSYVKILLSIILSPIYLLFEAIPGQNAFINWLKNLTGELITFPLVVGIFVLGSIIVDSASSGNLVQLPFLVGIDSKSFGYIIGMAILFMTPDLVKAVRAVFIPKPGIFDQAGPGVFFGGVTTGINTGISEISKVGGIAMYSPGFRKVLGNLPIVGGIFKDPNQNR
jgi:hypothetical protein